ncbi:MAG: hypothetical protein AB7Q17_15315 [Phycisphaerae bacterium]
MSFELVEPGAWNRQPPLEEGQVAIDATGTATMRAADLESAGIAHYCIVLADAGTLRIAIRAPRDDERALSVAVSVVRHGKEQRDAGRRRVSLGRAIKRCGVEIDAVRGRYDLRTKDDLLIIDLASVAKGAGGAPKPLRAPVGAARPASARAGAAAAEHAGAAASPRDDVPSVDPARNPARYAARPR